MACFLTDHLLLFNMGMITDMILTVAVVTAAAGAVAEFQFRIACVGATTDGTLVGVVCMLSGRCGFLCGGVGEGYHLGTVLLIFGCFLLLARLLQFDEPGTGKHIQYIFTKEQDVVGKRDHGEAGGGDGICQQAINYKKQIEDGEDACFDGNDEKQQELSIGEHSSIAEEEAQIQIGYIGSAAKNHAPDVHQHKTTEIEQIEAQCTPDMVHSATNGVIAVQCHSHQKQIAVIKGQWIGNQSPDLSLKNCCPIEDQQGVKNRVLRDLRHQIYQRAAKADVQHQIGNAHVAVLDAETVKSSA